MLIGDYTGLCTKKASFCCCSACETERRKEARKKWRARFERELHRRKSIPAARIQTTAPAFFLSVFGHLLLGR